MGMGVFVLGYPLVQSMGTEIKLTTGVVSSRSGFQGDQSQYQISAPVQPGNSGGPLFNDNGELIGIVSAKHTEAENVSYGVKLSHLKTLASNVEGVNLNRSSQISNLSRCRTLAICNRVSRPGCDVFVHHFDTVAGSFPSCSANHLLVRFFSTSTTLIRFISFVTSMLDYIICAYVAKLPKVFNITSY